MNIWKLLPIVAISCTTQYVQRPVVPPLPATTSSFEVAAGAPLASHPELYVAVLGEARARYDSELLGIGHYAVIVRLMNTGTKVAFIEPLRATFTVSREGVAFHCREHRVDSTPPPEPSWIHPGQSFDFVRNVDCIFPLPGHYEVRTFVHVADRGGEMTPGDAAGTLHVQIDESPHVPQRYPSREGLYVILTGHKPTVFLSPEAWTRGEYKIRIALVNAGRGPLRVGRGHIAFTTYRQDAQAPRARQIESLDFPPTLEPGSMHVASLAVTCTPAEVGHYDILGRFDLADGPIVDVARIHVHVTERPPRFIPEVWPR